MVERYVIPFSMVSNRAMHLQPSSIYETYTDYESVIRGIHNNNFNSLDKYIMENATNNAMANNNATNIINILSENNVKDSNRYNTYIREFKNNIIPSVKDLDSFKSVVESSDLEEDIKKSILETVDINIECNRILENNSKISSRFNMDLNRDCKYKDVKDVTESVCDKIDTYNMSLKKKLNIALEESLYSYYKSGVNTDKSLIVEGVVEYFLKENDYLSDKDMIGIRNVLDNNNFISQEHTNLVSYLYNEAVLYSDKINILTEASEDYRVKKLLKSAKEVKTVKAAKEVINDIFKFIFSSFIIASSVTFSEVVLLIASMFAMIALIGTTAVNIVKHIINKTDDLKNKESSLSPEEKKRFDMVVVELNKEIDKVKDEQKTVKESANILDQAIDKIAFDPSIFVIHEPDPEDDEFAFNMINDIIKGGKDKEIVKESKDYADSEDVSDLIKKYKADQNKSMGKLKATITRIFTKSPAQIIDETPKIFEFIRVFGIFSLSAIPTAIGPAIALVTFMADRFITMNLKRKDAEKVCDYFKKEKNKMEKKVSSLKDGDKKDTTEEYIQCLDKCITKLEDYRDSLYSTKELDRRNGYDEATMVNYSDKITLDEYMNNNHSIVCHYLDIAIQLIKNEVLRRCSGISLEEYELSSNKESAGKVFKDIPEDTLVKQYMTPDGIINIPLFMIKESVLGDVTDDLYITITDICSYVNQYLSNKCMVNNYSENDNIYIVFNYLQAICIGDLEQYCATEELKESTAYINFFSEAVDEIDKHSPSTIVSELCKNIDTLVYEYDLDEIITTLENSNLIYEEFIDSIKDYKETNTNPIIEANIVRALDKYSNINNTNNSYSATESLAISVDCISLLEEVINEAKDVKDNNKKKGNIIKNAKENIANKTSNIKNSIHNKKEIVSSKASEIGGKINLVTHKAANTAALSGEVAKKQIKGLSTKEKEMSRNIDISLSRLKKSIDNALTSNRREAIIKGSIIPSFSRIIKFAIGGGILFKINPGIAAITALGALIRSKSLNKKERYLLMDEIETELSVVDKELEIADRDGDIKKYRNLLTFKKKLQREMQRIRYDMNIHPSPAALDPED